MCKICTSFSFFFLMSVTLSHSKVFCLQDLLETGTPHLQQTDLFLGYQLLNATFETTCFAHWGFSWSLLLYKSRIITCLLVQYFYFSIRLYHTSSLSLSAQIHNHCYFAKLALSHFSSLASSLHVSLHFNAICTVILSYHVFFRHFSQSFRNENYPRT